MAEIGRTVQQNGISAANQGRQWIVRALEQFEVPLIRYALLFVHDVDTARDVVQDTFLKLCREDESDVAPHLNQWLYRVTRNRAIDVARKENRMKHSSAAEAILDRDSGPAEVVQQNEVNQNMLNRISKLPATTAAGDHSAEIPIRVQLPADRRSDGAVDVECRRAAAHSGNQIASADNQRRKIIGRPPTGAAIQARSASECVNRVLF